MHIVRVSRQTTVSINSTNTAIPTEVVTGVVRLKRRSQSRIFCSLGYTSCSWARPATVVLTHILRRGKTNYVGEVDYELERDCAVSNYSHFQ